MVRKPILIGNQYKVRRSVTALLLRKSTAIAYLQSWCARAGETHHQLPGVRSERVSQIDTTPQENAASMETLDKQVKSQNSARQLRRRRLSRAVNTTPGWQRNSAANVPSQLNGVARESNSAFKPVRRENARRNCGKRYSFIPRRLNTAYLRNAVSKRKHSPVGEVRQDAISQMTCFASSFHYRPFVTGISRNHSVYEPKRSSYQRSTAA